MVIDYFEHYKIYTDLIPELKDGIDFINRIKNNGPGKYVEKDMLAIIEEGQTSDISSRSFESHKKYIDVQYIVKGEEEIYWEKVDKLSASAAYDNEKDISLYNGRGQMLQIKEGMLYILFESDAHKCCGKIDKKSNAYKKVILKIKAKN